MKFRLLLSITAFLEASLPFPIQIYMLYQSLWFVYGQGDADLRWDLQSLSQAACFVWQDLLVFYLCCYCMALSARSMAGRGLPLSQDGPWAWEGAVCPLCLARLALWRLCLGRHPRFDLSWGAHRLSSCGKTLCKDNMEEWCVTEMLLFQDRHLQCFCSVWGHFHRYTKQLVCTWFASKKPLCLWITTRLKITLQV